MDIITYALCKKYIKDSLAGAGALKGNDGKSAYQVAKDNGFTGTEKQWVESLKGRDGYTPYIGENGNWFINGSDTFIPGRAITDYEDLNNLPKINGVELTGDKSSEDLGIDIPTKVSDLDNDSGFLTANDLSGKNVSIFTNDAGYITDADVPKAVSELDNDAGYITENDLPKKVSDLENDAGYLTSKDIEDFANKDEIPEKISDLTDDVGLLTTKTSFKTVNGETILGTGDIPCLQDVIDVKVNGTSVVQDDKIAYIDLTNAIMGRTFVTDITVGHLEAGTQINKDDTIASILYRILYQESLPTKVTLYFGGSDEVPTGVNDLDWKETVENLEPDELIANGCVHVIKTGNLETENGQYPTMISTKAVKLIQLRKWTVQGAEIFEIPFETVETNNYYIYYIPVKNYDEDEGGKPYVFTFAEV